MKPILIRTLTLLSFLALVGGFVIFRSGIMNDSIQTSPNGGAVNTTGKDSVKKDPAMIPSSKVLIIREKIFDSGLDSTAGKNDDRKLDMRMMGGSKSGLIFEPSTDTSQKEPK